MKQIFLSCFLFFLSVSFLHAQSSPLETEAHCFLSCDKNLVTAQALNIISDESARYYIKDNLTDINYKDPTYVNEEGGCISGTAGDVYCTIEGYKQVLKYYVYYPDPATYSYATCKPPVVIMVHGGGFSDCNGLDGAVDVKVLCQEFARKGFVVFYPEYRRGRLAYLNDNGTTNLNYITASQMLAYYRAFQDIRGFVRTVVAMQSDPNYNEPFSFNVNKIFIAGASAGSQIAMNVACYQTQAQINQIMPGCEAALGSIEADYYKGPTSVAYHDKIIGVLNMWGGMFLPPNQTGTGPVDPEDFFSDNTSFPPMICFHGLEDKVINPDVKTLFFPVATNPNHSESHCLDNGQTSFSLPSGQAGVTNMYLYGSKKIYENLIIQTPNSIPAELYLDCLMKHGLDNQCPGVCNCNISGCYQSEFGTGGRNKAEVNKYICERASTFFQAILNGKINLLAYGVYNDIGTNNGTTKFTECENYRHGCTVIADDDAGCDNTDNPCD